MNRIVMSMCAGALALASSLFATGTSQEIAFGEGEVGTLWFVELQSAPAVEGTSIRTLRSEKDAFRESARAAGVTFVERQAFDTLWNGLSLEVSPPHLARLSQVEGVKALYAIGVARPESVQVSPGTSGGTGLILTGADVAQASGYSGAGVRVAVVDIGVDYHHPDLGGCFGPDCRAAAGWDFVGDAFDPSSGNPARRVPIPDADPDDTCGASGFGGHGTHVAGIIGANGSVRGVAPQSTLLLYRIFGCAARTTDDLILTAMERALADGADVLNLSFGTTFQWPQHPVARAADRLVNRGVSVVAAFGNDPSGLYSGLAPAVGTETIGVASFETTPIDLPVFTILPGELSVGYLPVPNAPAPPTSGTFPMARTGTASSTADACTPRPPGSLSGAVALVRLGGCPAVTKVTNARSAGAVAVVLYASQAGFVEVAPSAAAIPVVATSGVLGASIDGRLAVGPVTLTWTDRVGSFANATGGLLSTRSAFGLSPTLSLKPDVGAPGAIIRSTLPLEMGAYGVMSGTSMSSPHVAGAIALVREAKPNTPVHAIRHLLQVTAEPKPWRTNPSAGLLDHVHRQGAGMLRIDRALQAPIGIEPGTLSLGESESGHATHRLTVENKASAMIRLDVAHAPALATGPETFAVSTLNAPAEVVLSASSLTIAAGGRATLDVMVTPAATLPDRSSYGGYLLFRDSTSGETYRVAYVGFKGDYQSITALTPTALGLPWLARRTGSGFTNQPVGATFTLSGDDVPWILVHLEHAVRRLRLEVFDANTGRAAHQALDLEYVPRSATATDFFRFAWGGMAFAGKRSYAVQDGQYRLRLSVLKALGDDDDPAHWEIWTSPVVTIDRP